jgi:hypothetical protein
MPRAPYDGNGAELAGLLGASFADRSAKSSCRILGLSGAGSVSSVWPWLRLSCATFQSVQLLPHVEVTTTKHAGMRNCACRACAARKSRAFKQSESRRVRQKPRVTSFQISRCDANLYVYTLPAKQQFRQWARETEASRRVRNHHQERYQRCVL